MGSGAPVRQQVLVASEMGPFSKSPSPAEEQPG